MLLSGLNSVFALISFLVMVAVVVAFVDVVRRPADAFPLADKQTKNFWLLVLGVIAAGLLVLGSTIFGIFGIAGAVSSLVYFLDVRPAVKGGSGGGGGRRGRGGSSSDGPYGPTNNRW